MIPGSGAVEEVGLEHRRHARLWSRAFLQLCAGGFLSYASQQPITPLIALWVVHLGGSATTVGLASAAFSAPSFLLRPIVGRLCDTWSTKGVFAAGCIISGIGSLLILIPNLAFVFVSQAINGLGWAGLNTGGNTLVAQIAPSERRGAASTYFQMSRGSLGFYLPYLALKAKATFGFWLPFLATGVAGLLAAPTVIGMEVAEAESRAMSSGEPTTNLGKPGLLDRFVERTSILPSLLLFTAMVTIPATQTFIVLYAKKLTISEGEIASLFLIRGVISILVQPLLAGLSDRIGRAPVIALGLSATASSMLLISAASTAPVLICAMVIGTVAGALTPPTLQALAIDRARPSARGAAMATYSLSFQMGSFAGGLIGGFFIDSLGYRAFYALFALPAVAGIAILLMKWREVAYRPATYKALPESGARA